jgi:hypothetical protein
MSQCTSVQQKCNLKKYLTQKRAGGVVQVVECLPSKFKPQYCQKTSILVGSLWLRPIILAIQEAEIRRITVRRQPRANSSRPYLEKTITEKGW